MTYRARIICTLSLAAIVVLLLQLAPAQAQNPRFVASSGSDADDCLSPASACRTLQRAHDAFGGAGYKIVVLDSGDFNAVTITKSIAIAATGVHATLFGGFSTKITIDAGPNDVIDIDGLAMGRDFLGTASSGIDFVSGGKLHVRNCVIRNFGTAGIHVRGAGPKQVFVSDCTIADNKQGIWAQGGGAVVHISNSKVVKNGKGLNVVNGGEIVSLGNNAIIANGTNGAPTSTASLK